MKKHLLFVLVIFCCINMNAQSDGLWQKTSSASVLKKKVNDQDSGNLYFKLNSDFLKSKLSPITDKSKKNTSEITFPNPDGVLERYNVWESSNFDPELQAKYPDIRAY